MYSSPPIWTSWGQLYESVMTGQPSFDRIHGTPFFGGLSGSRLVKCWIIPLTDGTR